MRSDDPIASLAQYVWHSRFFDFAHPHGATGYATRKNGNTVPVTNNGTITGTIG